MTNNQIYEQLSQNLALLLSTPHIQQSGGAKLKLGDWTREKKPHYTSTERILLAARELFLLQGFDETNVRQIAAHSGCSAACIYKHFSCKEDLLNALVMPYQQELKDIMETASQEFLAALDYLEEGTKLAALFGMSDTKEGEYEYLNPLFEKILEVKDYPLLYFALFRVPQYSCGQFCSWVIEKETQYTQQTLEVLRKRGFDVGCIEDEVMRILVSFYFFSMISLLFSNPPVNGLNFNEEEKATLIKQCNQLHQYWIPYWMSLFSEEFRRDYLHNLMPVIYRAELLKRDKQETDSERS